MVAEKEFRASSIFSKSAPRDNKNSLLLNILLSGGRRYGLKYTWNINTQALEKAPYWAKHIVNSGAELSCASKRYIDYMSVDVETEATHIAEAFDSLQKISGDTTLPHGWMVDRRSNASIRLYAREHWRRGLPLLYSSDSCSDDLPYWTPSPLVADGHPDTGLLMVPFS